MKKSKLIEMLSNIPGDPDIMLWNGYVGDFQDIDKTVCPQRLVKMTFNGYVSFVLAEEKINRKDFNYELSSDEKVELKKFYKRQDWEINDYVSQDYLTNKQYKEKTVYLMQPSSRGKSSYDRLGKVDY